MKVKDFIESMESWKKGFDDGDHDINPYECEMRLDHLPLTKDGKEYELAGSLEFVTLNTAFVNFQTKEYLKKEKWVRDNTEAYIDEDGNLKIKEKKNGRAI